MKRLFTFLLLLVSLSPLFAQLTVGGYATYTEMTTGIPTLLDTTLYLVKVENEVLKRTNVYELRFTNARGYDRSWVSEKRLWGYSDGREKYYFDNGMCSPLKGWNQSYAWYYTLVTRMSSGTNGLTFIERPMVYSKAEGRSFEATFKKLEELLQQAPTLLQEYNDTKRRDRDLGYFLNRFIIATKTYEDPIDSSDSDDSEDDFDGPTYF